MTDSIEIRIATVDDIEMICTVLNEFFAHNEELQPTYFRADIERGEYPESIIENDSADFLVALRDNTVLGLIHISQMKTPPFGSVVPYNYAEINVFMVTASQRKKGIGTKLMGMAKQWSKVRNLDYIELAVLRNAKDAFRFYEQSNFDTVMHTMRCTLK